MLIFRQIEVIEIAVGGTRKIGAKVVQNQQFAPTILDLNQENEKNPSFSIPKYWDVFIKMLTLQTKGKRYKGKSLREG